MNAHGVNSGWWMAVVLAVGLAAPGLATAGDGLAEGEIAKTSNSASGIDEKVGAQLPLDLVLRDESEKPITLRDCIAGKPTILVPMYYRCPMLCNAVLRGLVDTLRELPQDYSVGGKFNVVAISFDPLEHGDLGTAKKSVVLEQYGRVGAENGWHFLTGSKEAIKELMAVIGWRFEFDKSFKEYNHPTGILTATPEGKLARYFYGIDYSGEFNIPGGKTTLRLSLVEASEGKMGSLLDKLYLGCYRFDHMKGYSLDVLWAVRIGGLLTLAVVGGVLVVAFRREWRGRDRAATPEAVANSPAGGAALPAQKHDGEGNV